MEHHITLLEMVTTNALSFVVGGIVIGFIVYRNSNKIEAKVEQLETYGKEVSKIKAEFAGEATKAETVVKAKITSTEDEIISLYRAGQAKIVGLDNKLLHDFKNP